MLRLAITRLARERGHRAALPFLLVLATVHLVVAWPGAGERGLIAEEVQPFLRHYPKVLEVLALGDHTVHYLPPNDDAALLDAVDHGREVTPRWVGTLTWPELGYQGRHRVWPVFVRGHQSAIGTYWGIALGPLLGGGSAGVRRSAVLLGLVLLLLVFALARRLGLSRPWATVAALGCALSPGLWFFGRTTYTLELASRVAMLAVLYAAAPRVPLTSRRALVVGLGFAVAILCRATIASAMAPPLVLMLLHPRRWAGPGPAAGALAVGGGLPIVLVAAMLLGLPFAPGTAPAAGVMLEGLAGRTLTAPATAWMQLAWVVDARVVLSPLVNGDLHVTVGWVRGLAGGVVVAVALVRWWRARAGEAERLFVAALLGNALVGAWLYGDPRQFQLGMSLEPLFVLALVEQISTVFTGTRAALLVAVLLGLRGMTLLALAADEQRTDNPMLSGRAQGRLVELLRAEEIGGDDLITTAYDHVGVIEALTGEALRPIHAWRPLQATGVPEDELAARWGLVLDAHPACHVLLTRAPNLVAGPFTDHAAVAAALGRAVAARGGRVERRQVIQGDGGSAVFELVDISPCRRAARP